MFLRPALLGLVLPAAALFAAAFALRRREREGAGLVLSLLLALLFFFAMAAWNGFPPFPPVTTTQQLGDAVLAAAGVAFLVRRLPPAAAWAARTAFLLAVLGWAAWPKVGHAWPTTEGVGHVLFWSLGIGAAWEAVERRAGRTAALPLYAPLALAVGGGAVLLFLGGSALLAQWGGSLALLVAAAGAALALQHGDEAVSVAATAVPAFGLLVANGLWYSALPFGTAFLLVVALAAPSLADRLLPRILSPLARAAWGVLAAGVALLAAAGICWAVVRPSLGEY